MLKLTNLSSPKGAHKNTKRIGRGQGSGWGTQAGKGHKGQKARSGGGVRTGFEGGALPLYMKLPKRGFSNYHFRNHFAIVNLGQINEKFESEVVNKDSLIDKGLLKGADRKLPVKILGNGELKKPLTFMNIEKISKGAAERISAAGGKIENTETKKDK